MSVSSINNPGKDKSAMSWGTEVGVTIAVAIGAFAVIILSQSWIPALASSLTGDNPKAYWYMSRGAAFAALGSLWLSMMLGLLITDKIAKSWPGAPAAFAIHEFASLFGMALAIFHALILLGDRYINYQLVQILLPFASAQYHPVWVGFGQIGLYVWAIINISFYVRQRIGPKTWKFIHYASFFNFLVAVMHGVASGTDTSLPWAQSAYWCFGGSFLLLTVYRIIFSLIPPKARPLPTPPTPTPQVQP